MREVKTMKSNQLLLSRRANNADGYFCAYSDFSQSPTGSLVKGVGTPIFRGSNV